MLYLRAEIDQLPTSFPCCFLSPSSLPSSRTALSGGGAPAWRLEFCPSRQSGPASSGLSSRAAQLWTPSPLTWEACLKSRVTRDLHSGVSPAADRLLLLCGRQFPLQPALSAWLGRHWGWVPLSRGAQSGQRPPCSVFPVLNKEMQIFSRT